MDRHDRIALRFRAERWLATFPGLRIAACAALLAGVSAALVSGVLLLDSWLKSALDLVLAIVFLALGAAMWEME
jgi:hypothetical protein